MLFDYSMVQFFVSYFLQTNVLLSWWSKSVSVRFCIFNKPKNSSNAKSRTTILHHLGRFVSEFLSVQFLELWTLNFLISAIIGAESSISADKSGKNESNLIAYSLSCKRSKRFTYIIVVLSHVFFHLLSELCYKYTVRCSRSCLYFWKRMFFFKPTSVQLSTEETDERQTRDSNLCEIFWMFRARLGGTCFQRNATHM